MPRRKALQSIVTMASTRTLAFRGIYCIRSRRSISITYSASTNKNSSQLSLPMAFHAITPLAKQTILHEVFDSTLAGIKQIIKGQKRTQGFRDQNLIYQVITLLNLL